MMHFNWKRNIIKTYRFVLHRELCRQLWENTRNEDKWRGDEWAGWWMGISRPTAALKGSRSYDFDRLISLLFCLHAWSASMSPCLSRTANMRATPDGTTITASTACPWPTTTARGPVLIPGTQMRLNTWTSNGFPCCRWLTCGAYLRSGWWLCCCAWRWLFSSWLPTSWPGTTNGCCSRLRRISSGLPVSRWARPRLRLPVTRIL